jgi:NAD(P)-dependent dehydrogenase (short-subunit alcohol dehydrogenase family)
LKVFVEGPSLFLHHAVPLLEGAVAARGGSASVVNISSVVAQRHSASLPVYSMAKAAVDVLTKSAAGTLGPKGIRVNSVAPGPVFTDIFISAGLTQEASDGFFKELGKKSALGRAGQPQEVANLVSALLQERCRHVVHQLQGMVPRLHMHVERSTS